MRIIGGEWRGRKIEEPRGRDVTRPTTDRVREACASMVMSAFDFDLDEVRVLDAFGGSGAVHNKPVRTHKKPMHGFEQSITITLPPMSTLYFEVPTKRTAKTAADKAKKPGKKTAAKKTTKAAPAEKAVKKPGRKPKAAPEAPTEKDAKKPGRKPKAAEAPAEKPVKKPTRKAKAEPEPAAEEAPKKRGRKPKAAKE